MGRQPERLVLGGERRVRLVMCKRGGGQGQCMYLHLFVL